MGAVLTVYRSGRPGQPKFDIKVVETGQGTTSKWDTSGAYPLGILPADMPSSGMFWFQWDGNAGQPRLGKGSSAWNDSKALEQIATTPMASQTYVEVSPTPFTFPPGAARVLYGHSQFVSGSANAANWLITIVGA